MQEKSFLIRDPAGIHARPAEILVSRMLAFPCRVGFIKDGRYADGKDLMAVMSLGVKRGETLTVCMEGEQEQEAMEALEAAMEECSL